MELKTAYVKNFEEELLSSAGKDWAPIQNLDSFCTKIYNYYVEKGFWCIVVSRVTSLINLAFTICFSTFLLLFVDWHAVVECHRTSCRHLIREDVLSSPSFGEVVVLLYFFIFSVYWFWSLVGFFFALRDGLEMQAFFSEKLQIRDAELPMLEWFSVLERVVRLQQKLKLCLVKDLDALDITNRIMRKDNYMIALVNAGIFKFESLCFGEHSGVFGKTLEWNLRVCILNAMFDDQFSVKSFLDPGITGQRSLYSERMQLGNGVKNLQRRLFFMGILNLLMVPFIAIFMVIFFFLRHAEELHSKKASLSLSEWTCYAKWHLREYNELPHFFEKRLRKAYEPSRAYMDQFPSSITPIIAQCIAYVSGAIVGVILILSLTGSKAILDVYVGDRSLIWYLAVFTALLALSRSLIPEILDVYNPHKAMAEVVKHTHYCPRRWRQRFHEPAVKKEFESLFKATFGVFLCELMCVATTPFVLMFSLPSRAESIIQCVKQVTVEVDGVGDVCGQAAFNMDLFAERNGAYKTVTIASMDEGEEKKQQVKRKYADSKREETEPDDGKAHLEPFLSHQGKLEKSFVSFVCNHPYYQANLQGAKLLTALKRVHAPGAIMGLASQINGGNQTLVEAKEVADEKQTQSDSQYLTSSQLPLSHYMHNSQDTAGANPREAGMTSSDQMLVCSFSQILEVNRVTGKDVLDEKHNVAGKNKLFSALENIYESQSELETVNIQLTSMNSQPAA